MVAFIQSCSDASFFIAVMRLSTRAKHDYRLITISIIIDPFRGGFWGI